MCAVPHTQSLLLPWGVISCVLGGKVHTIKMATDFLSSPLLWLFIPGQHVPRITKSYFHHFGIRLWPPEGDCIWNNSTYPCGISLDLFLDTQKRSFACLFLTLLLHKFNCITFAIVWLARAFISPRWTAGNVCNPESFVKTHSAWENAVEWIRCSGWHWAK